LLASRDGDYLVITPAGFYAASGKGAEKMLHIVRGFETYSVLQFYEHLNRPDLVEARLKGDPEGKYADAASKLDLDKILNSGPAPQLGHLEKKTEKSNDSVKLAVRIKDTGGGIGGKVVWRVNGKTRGNLSTSGLAGPPTIGRSVTMSQDLKVDPGNTPSVCPSKVRKSSPVFASQSLSVPSTLPERRRSPSGENATEVIGAACPSKLRNSWPLAVSQSLSALSAPPASRRLPSGETAVELSASPYPSKLRSSRPLVASQGPDGQGRTLQGTRRTRGVNEIEPASGTM
jgi:hypothetical protein